MLFNSFRFIIFFPIVVFLYYCMPRKLRIPWLLVCNIYFYACWGLRYALVLLLLTAVGYAAGLMIEMRKNSRRKALIFGLSVILGTFVFFKYFNFVIRNVGNLLHTDFSVGGKISIVAPVGISFYCLQIATYLIDLYRGEIEAEHNFIRYAAFATFFPSLCSGPIERAKRLLPQMKPHSFEYGQAKDGILLMLWGMFQKVVIADRIAIVVDTVYGNCMDMPGYLLIFATVLYAFQIYCDFSGYSDIAVGAAQVLGFKLDSNFHQPYFSRSMKEFWRNWHMSLSTWFRDYLYIPLGGNRKGRLVRYRNLMIVFLVSGLWHGASWNYIVWGGIHGGLQVIGDILSGVRGKLIGILKVRTKCFSYHLFQGLLTFAMADLAWVFFRATGAREAFRIIRRMISPGLAGISKAAFLALGLDAKNYCVLGISLLLLLAVDVMRRKMDVREFIRQQNLVFRWGLYYCVIFSILIFGIYGPGYDAGTFVYMQF